MRDLRLIVDDAPFRAAFLAALALASFESAGLAAILWI